MWLVDLCLYCLTLIRDHPLELIRELWRLNLKMPSFLSHLQDALVRLEILANGRAAQVVSPAQ